MCGIGGIFRPSGLGGADLTCLDQMDSLLQHRGPDASGSWTDREVGIGLIHRRLSIIDLSPAGAQPMTSHSGRYQLVYNGEIYNYPALRTKLEDAGQNPEWRGHSDTEVLLAAIEAWGVAATLRRLRGMFALALWDRAERTLTLGRDAMGEKPLYVGRIGDGGLVFASELKAIACHGDFGRHYDRDALAQSLRLGYIPAPRTLYRDAWKVMPGSFATIRQDDTGGPAIASERYFDLLQEADQADPFTGSEQEATDQLENLLARSVEQQMISDVPLGAFLSGGIDSSTIAALMQASSTGAVQTFALGFSEAAENEADHARAVAQHLGTDHHEITLSAADALDLVEKMPAVYDEPFADPSQLPTYLVAGFARKHVTVSLSGDGADELFGGYGRYHAVHRRRDGSALAGLQRGLEATYFSAAMHAARGASRLGLERLGRRDLEVTALRLEGRRNRSQQHSALVAYDQGYAQFDKADLLVQSAERADDAVLGAIEAIDGLSALGQLTLFDMGRYLPDDILVKVDRAAMAHSLETRVPFLNVDVVRFALTLPDSIRMAGGMRKGVLKMVLDRHVPQALWDRPKQGFGIPVDQWLRGPFKELAESLFSPSAIAKDDVLDPILVPRLWRDFLNGNKRLKTVLWSLLILQLTLRSK